MSDPKRINEKVIVYAEKNHGADISEKELRKIVSDLEQRGFTGYYERVSMGKFMLAKQAFGFLKELFERIE